MSRGQRTTLAVFFGVIVIGGYFLNEYRYRTVPAVPRHTGWAHPSAQGVRLMSAGQLDEAEMKFRAALAMAERAGDNYGRGTSLQNLGWVKREAKQFREAESLYRQALPLLESTKHAQSSQRSVLLNDLAICCMEGGHTAEAVSFMKRAVALDEDDDSDATRSERVRRLRNYAVALLADARPLEAAGASARAAALAETAPAPTTSTVTTRPSARGSGQTR